MHCNLFGYHDGCSVYIIYLLEVQGALIGSPPSVIVRYTARVPLEPGVHEVVFEWLGSGDSDGAENTDTIQVDEARALPGVLTNVKSTYLYGVQTC